MRRTFIYTILILFIPLASCSESKSLKGTKPNIILVITDDQGIGDLACLGNPVIKTPHLDNFYEMATRFTDFHVSPTCAPTRSAIFSGRHEFRNGVTHTILERERMALSTTTFPQLLQEAGYETGIFGKWHLGDEEAYLPGNRGFKEALIHGAGGIGQGNGRAFIGSSAGDFPPNRENRYFDNVLLHNETVVRTEGYCTDVFFDAALGWIKKQHQAGTPYFAYITTNAPHGPLIAPDKYEKRWLDDGWSETVAGRYGMIENIDDNFGRLVQKLDEWDAWDNTLLIFMTDNGQAGTREASRNGEKTKLYTPFKTGKGSPYEGGTHVPSFWYWKGVLGEGVDIPALTAHIDLYRTFCDLAGVDITGNIQEIDGRTLLPLLENPEAEWPDRYLFTHVGRWSKGADPDEYQYRNAAVRTRRWRMVMPRSGGGFELYDISTDPYEKQDVAGQFPEVIEELKAAFDQWWKETTPLMVNEDHIHSGEQALTSRYNKQLEEKGIPDWTLAKY
jgi:arylsulfatase